MINDIIAKAGTMPGWTVAPDNCEGVRVQLAEGHGSGWFLLRLSLHDPLLPLNIESDIPGGAAVIARELLPLVQQWGKVDCTVLEKFAQE